MSHAATATGLTKGSPAARSHLQPSAVPPMPWHSWDNVMGVLPFKTHADGQLCRNIAATTCAHGGRQFLALATSALSRAMAASR
eukprot:12849020-Alexandrium_andersonii.AAC.1